MIHKSIDLRGLKCPQLILEALQQIRSKVEGEVLEIKINDELATHSIPDSARDMGYQVEVHKNSEKEWVIIIS